MSERNISNVLVVDDDPDICANFSDILTDQGFAVDVAYNGPRALELIEENTYDVALLDLKLPGMDGLELCKRIKKRRSGIVAIMITAYATDKTMQEAEEADIWKLLPKPVAFPVLLSVVEEALGQPLVIIVDDDHDYCKSLADILRQKNYRVCMTHDIPGAQDRLAHTNYQVVLVDMKLPQGDGRQVLEIIRRSNSDARIVLITGYRTEMEHLMQEALDQGGDAVLYKPIDVEHLLEAIRPLPDK